MQKKYIVRLTDEEREHLEKTIKKLSGSGQKIRRGPDSTEGKMQKQVLNWTDRQIADAFNCRTKTVENIRQQLVLYWLLAGIGRQAAGTPGLYRKLLGGEQEAQIIALRLGSPPVGYANWSLRLARLAR